MKIINRHVIKNTFKIVVAAIVSILLAHFFDLNYEVSTGIVSILTIQPTKRETIETAIGRLMAFIIALIVAYISFNLFGLNLTGFFVYLLVFILICQMFGWTNAMTMNSVLVSHFLTGQSMNLSAIVNEVMIFGIGVSVGILANMHLRKNVDYIEKLKDATDEQIKKLLEQMSVRILNNDVIDYSKESFFELRNHIRIAKNVAEENYKNQLRREDIFDLEYIRMRDKQYQVLYEMYKLVSRLDTKPITAEKLSEFMNEMSVSYNRDNTCEELMEHFNEMDKYMKASPLPVERKEFENRATLYGLMRLIEEFLQLKMDFMKKHM